MGWRRAMKKGSIMTNRILEVVGDGVGDGGIIEDRAIVNVVVDPLRL